MTVNGARKSVNIEIDKGSVSYAKLCRDLTRYAVHLYGVEMKRTNGDYTENDDLAELRRLIDSQKRQEAPENQQEAQTSINLQSLYDAYRDENVRANNWARATLMDYDNAFRIMLDYFGDVQVHTIDSRRMQGFKLMLMKLPANFYKATKQFEGVTVQDIDSLKGDFETLSISTINKYLGVAKALFNHAVSNGFIERNCAEGLQIKSKRIASQERDIFSDEDLHKLFHSKKYKEDKFKHPHEFWLPILGLYTGCRIEELCQLKCDDIKQVDDVWCLDINDDDDDKRLKTIHSRRLIPLHSFLLEDLNFPEYVRSQRSQGNDRIFPELKRIGDKWSHYPSKRFGTYKKECGIEAARGQKTFHSLRHNFTDALKQKDVTPTIIDELTGHAVYGESMGRYGKRYKPQVLAKTIEESLSFNVDFGHLKRSRFTY